MNVPEALQLLVSTTLLHAARARLESCEPMGVMDDWTRLWTPQTRRYLRVQALPFSAAAAVELARRIARRGGPPAAAAWLTRP
ncbi:MAG: hypothetical protein IPF94_12430 [Betaproteobacteria bacterium]|nr:hypothetical protein [Betaproteobacteria bacterium]